MNKAEALEFLELPESASDQEIRSRLAEKLAYFELLSEKSPSAFLRRVHGQHVAKVKLIQKESLLWPSDIAKIPEPVEQPEPVISIEVPIEKYEAEPEPETDTQNEMVLQSGSADQQQIPEVPELIVLSEAAKVPENMPAINSEPQPKIDPIPEISLQPVFEGEEEIVAAQPQPDKAEEIIALQPEMVSDPEIVQDLIPAEQLSIAVPDIQPESLEDESVFSSSGIIQSIQGQETPVSPEPTTFIPTVEWTKTQQKSRPAPEPVAWLVRHTENQSVKKIPVFPGKNFIGRKPQPGMKPFIQVEEDPFVSRIHAALYADGSGVYHFYISDSSASNGGKASKNGTYVNGSEERINAKVKLKDRDTIQIGVSKFVLRCKITNLKKMLKEVEDSDFMHTVVIDPHGQ